MLFRSNFSTFVTGIDEKRIHLSNGESIDYNLAFWCGGLKNKPITDDLNKINNVVSKFGIPVNNFLQVLCNNQQLTNEGFHKNVFAIGDCSSRKNQMLPPTAQVAYQQGKYLADIFNNLNDDDEIDLSTYNEFDFENKGQICYIGNGESVFKSGRYIFKGKIMGYFNNFVHIYNGINFPQKFKFIRDVLI